jgi:hypothetical protein
MKSKKILGLLAVLFFTFGITYLDFENLTNSDNLRPYIMMGLGAVLLIYLWMMKKNDAE